MIKKSRIPIRLPELRAERNISQRQLGRLITSSGSVIARWEKGILEPSAENIIALCEFFGCSADFLLGLKDE